MLKKNIAVTLSLTGDLHSYSERRLSEVRKLFTTYHPDINLAIGDFPHQFTQEEASNFKYIDVAVPGNHEFYRSSDSLEEIKYKVPFVSISTFNEYQQQLFPSYKLFNIKGKKITVIGMNIFPEAENLARDERYSIIPFSRSLEIAARLTQQLKARTDLFVYLSHCGIDHDIEIFESMPQLAGVQRSKMLIFGGHNHITNPLAGSILESRILHSGNNLDELGLARVGFQEDGSTQIFLENISLVDKHKVVINNSYPVETVSARYGLNFIDNDFFHVNPLGALFTEKMRRDYGADVAIINSGSLRDTIQTRYNQKNAFKIARRIIPFAENYFVTFWANEEQLIEIIKKELAILNANKDAVVGMLDNKIFFQVSGIKYTYSRSKEGVFKLTRLSLQKKDSITNREETRYKVVLPNFLWDVLELEKMIGAGEHLVHDSIQDTMLRLLQGNSLKTFHMPENIYQRKVIK